MLRALQRPVHWSFSAQISNDLKDLSCCGGGGLAGLVLIPIGANDDCAGKLDVSSSGAATLHDSIAVPRAQPA